MSKGDNKIKITELFMAQADRDRRFFGSIKRETDSDGLPVIRGEITMKDGFLLAQADTQQELGKKLDEMILMVLDFGLHSEAGVTSEVAGNPYFLN